MANYLVTGGAGFIGSNVVRAILAQGDHVRVIDDLSTGKHQNLHGTGVEPVIGDIRDSQVVDQVMQGIDFVIHLAALPSVPFSVEFPAVVNEVNVGGTIELLEAARKHGVKRLVLASTCAIYGDDPELPKHEDLAPCLLSPYATSKLSAEFYCQTYTRLHGLATSCLRFFNVYGPRQDPNGAYAAVIPRFVEKALAEQPLEVFGDGTASRDFVSVHDVCRALLLACHEPRAVGQVINVASGRTTSLRELIAALESGLGRKLDVTYGPPRPGDILHSSASTAKAQELLKLKAETSLEQGIAELVGATIP